jgi:heterodisulfide reductase subunit C
MADHMTDTPRKVMAYVIAGDRERALQSDSIWYCASCYSCAVRCSAGISVTDVMAALKSLAAPAVNNVSTAFCNAFTRSVIAGGRVHEAGAAIRAGLASGPAAMLRLAPMGLGLVVKGRMSLLPHRIGGAAEVTALAKAVAKRKGLSAHAHEGGHA